MGLKGCLVLEGSDVGSVLIYCVNDLFVVGISVFRTLCVWVCLFFLQSFARPLKSSIRTRTASSAVKIWGTA